MPELPEVEHARGLVEARCVGRRVAELVTEERGGGPRDGLFDGIVCRSSASALKSVVGATLLAARRKGKQMWLEFSGGRYLLIHLGMTGALVVRGVAAASYQKFRVHDEAWPPRFAKLEAVFAGRGAARVRLAFCDPRRLGRISVSQACPTASPPVSLLAADPTAPRTVFALGPFSAAIGASGACIKAILLDQHAVVCGVGNWIADEVLYQARIHPACRASSLSSAQVGVLYKTLRRVCLFACSVDAESSRFPKSWLFHYRWGKGKQGTAVPGVGPVSFETVGGRTSAVVLSVQRRGVGGAPDAGGGSRKRGRETSAPGRIRSTRRNKSHE